MANNKNAGSIHVLRSNNTGITNNSDVIVGDGQPFYNKDRNLLAIGTGGKLRDITYLNASTIELDTPSENVEYPIVFTSSSGPAITGALKSNKLFAPAPNISTRPTWNPVDVCFKVTNFKAKNQVEFGDSTSDDPSALTFKWTPTSLIVANKDGSLNKFTVTSGQVTSYVSFVAQGGLSATSIASTNDVIASNNVTATKDVIANNNITAEKNIEAKVKITAPIIEATDYFNAKSDARLKENIVPFKCNESILDLPIYKFNFKSDESKLDHVGCLAQDLKEICPEIVHENSEGYLSIEETKLVYLLIDEVKKLRIRVKNLEDRLNG